MGRDQGRRNGGITQLEQQQALLPTPGRRTLTMGPAGAPAVQRKAVEPGKRTLTQQLGAGPRPQVDASIQAVAARGVAGTARALPYRDVIQRSFGRHDVSQISAHIGGAATAASAEIGAQAYATGTSVAFASAPDLHTAAHEAAHVVQQRGGVQLAGGVGDAGDAYERHADQVADAVVAGTSAEALLDRHAGTRTAPAAGALVQRKLAVQAEITAGNIKVLNFSGRSDSPFGSTMGSHSTAWLVHCDHLRARLIGRTPVDALTVLGTLGAELKKLPTAKLLDAMDATDLSSQFDKEHGVLTTKVAAAKVRMASKQPLTEDEAVSLVQECAAAYLAARNFLPGATVDTTKPDGRYESGHRGVLVGHEKLTQAQPALALRTAFLGLFDLSALAALADHGDDERARRGPGVGKPDAGRLGMLLGQHLIEARDTYPQAFKSAAFTQQTLAQAVAHPGAAAIAKTALQTLAGHAPDTSAHSATFEGTQAVAGQIVLSDDGKTIKDVRAGRAPSPFNNTMGAHTTAWVVHEDAMRTAMVGKAPEAALVSLLQMARNVEVMPTFRWVPNLGPKVGPVFQVAHDRLKVLIAEGDNAPGNSGLGILQRLAQQLLSVLNLMPAATTDLDSTRSGNGEASIEAMRTAGRSDFDISRQLWTNLDVAALRKLFDEEVEPHEAAEDARNMREGGYNDRTWHNQDDTGAFWDLRAPGVGHSNSEERLAVVLSQHRFAIDHAYPWIRADKKTWRQAYASIHTAQGIMAELGSEYPRAVCADVVTRMHAIRPLDEFDPTALMASPVSPRKTKKSPVKNLTKNGGTKKSKNHDEEEWGT